MTKPCLFLAALGLVLAGPAFATDVEQRIKFAPGQSSATVTGHIGERKVSRPGEVRDRYHLAARKGQTLTITVTATKPVMVAIWHDDYNQGWLGYKTGAKTTQSYKLPASTDYEVDVEVDDHVRSSDYRLTATIH